MKTFAVTRGSTHCCLMLCMLLLAACAGTKGRPSDQQAAPNTPRIEFTELAHDFGKASQNQSLKHSFTFKNRGSSVLTIQNVRSSCGCTAALASGKEIPPGQTGTIDVTFNTGSRQGKNEKTITVTTNDPLQQTVTLKISADIEVLLAVAPQQLVFGQIKKGDTAVRYAAMIGNDKDSVKILSAESSHASVQVAADKNGFDNSPDKQIKVTVLPGMKPGRFHERVTITTDHPSIKTLLLTVAGEVVGNFTVSPQTLSFGVIQPNQKVERFINLKATGEKSFKVLKAETGDPAVSAAVEKVADGREYNVRISIVETALKPAAVLRGKLLLTTSDKEQPVVEIPYWGRAAGQTP